MYLVCVRKEAVHRAWDFQSLWLLILVIIDSSFMNKSLTIMKLVWKDPLDPSSQEHGVMGLVLEVLSSSGKGNGCCAADFRSTSLSLWDLVSGFFEKVVEINVLCKNKPQSPIKHRVWYWPDWSGSAWLSQPFHSAEGKKQFPKLGRNWKGFLLPEIPFFLCFGQHHYFKPTPEEGFCTRYLLMEFPPLPRAFQRKEAGFKACELLASLVIVYTVWQIHEQVC